MKVIAKSIQDPEFEVKNTNKWAYSIAIGLIFGVILTFSLGGIFLSSLVLISCLLIRRFSKEEDRKFLTYLFISGITARIIIYFIFAYFSILSGKGGWLIGDAYGYYSYAWIYTQKIEGVRNFISEDINGKIFYDQGILNFFGGNYEKALNWMVYGDYGFNGFTILLGYLFYVFEPLKFSGRLINILFGVLNGIFVYDIVKGSFEKKTAKISAVLVTFFPSILIWSLDFTKEPIFVFMLTIMLWSLLRFGKTNNLLYIALICFAALIQSTIRKHFWMIGLAIFIPSLFLVLKISFKKKAMLVVMAIGITAVISMNHRINYSPVRVGIEKILHQHIGSVGTGGFCYRILDDKYYSVAVNNPIENITTYEILNAFVTAWPHFLLEPYVWDIQSKPMIMVIPQIILWYLLLIFALLGVVVGFRYNWKFTLVTVGYVLLMSSIIALCSANIGTVFRHRDMVTTFYLIFSSIGIANLFRKRGV